MASSDTKFQRLAFAGALLAVALIIGLLLTNIIRHALHHTSTTAVSTHVLSVRPLSASEVEIHARVTSLATERAQISCLVGVERPATPLAFPTRTTVTLGAGDSVELTVRRHLIKPDAAQVRVSDVAFTCT